MPKPFGLKDSASVSNPKVTTMKKKKMMMRMNMMKLEERRGGGGQISRHKWMMALLGSWKKPLIVSGFSGFEFFI